MGSCNSANADKSLESADPPVALAEDTPHPAPITVDLHNPPVDASAPLDERDIDLVQQTFARVAMLGAENVGWVLFMNIFQIAPEAKGLFPFKDDDLMTSTRMRVHAGRVVSTVATAVSLLRDLDALVPVLHSLGLRHVGYSVIPAHYDVVGQALIKSLQTALGPQMTPAVTNAYLKVFTIVKNTMIEKCDYSRLVAETAAAEPTAETDTAKAEAPPAPDAKEPEAANEPEAAAAAPEENTETKAPAEDAKSKREEDAKDKEKKDSTDDSHKKKAPAKKAPAKKAPSKKQPDHTKKDDDEASKKKKVEEDEEATKKNAEDAAEAAKKEGPSPDEQLVAAAASGDDKTVAKLIKAGANVNFADSEGKTALHHAAEKGFEEIIGRLSSNKKIKISVKTIKEKETALHFACREGHRDCAVMIVRGGVEVNAKNKAGKTAVELAKDNELAQWLRTNNPAGTAPPWQGKKMK